MAAEQSWPPKSPRAALLSSPSGRRKYLSNDHNVQRSPVKYSATTPNLLDRLRAARTDNDYLDTSDPSQEDEEDEETLRLQLAAIEAKLKLKKLQSKSRTNTPRPTSRRPSSADGSRPLQSWGQKYDEPQRSSDVLVGISPTKKPAPMIEPKSPNRVRLGIDKGIKGADVSLRRAKSTNERSITRINLSSRVTPRTELGSQRSTTSTGVGSVQSFSERMSSVRDNDRSKDAQRNSALLGRSKSFNVKKEEIDTFRQLADEQPKRDRSPIPRDIQQAYSRDDILRSKEGVTIDKPHASNRRQSPSRPSSHNASHDPGNNQPDSSLFEVFSGLHLASRILPHSFLKRTLPEDKYAKYSIPDLLRDVKSPEFELPNEVGDYVVFGIIASKSTPLDHKQKVEQKSVGSNDWERKWEDGSQNHRKFIVMTLTDLDWSLDLYLFGTAVPRYHRLTPGTVVAILNPTVMPPKRGKEDTGAFSLTLHDGDDTVLEIGQAKHLGHCTARRKDKSECGQWINALKTDICEWHLNLALSKTQSDRMGLNTGSNGAKLNNRDFMFDSRTKGSRAGQGRGSGLQKTDGQKFDFSTQSSYFMSSNPGFAARAQALANGASTRAFDPDDPFIGEGQLSRDKKSMLRKRSERQEKEEEIAKKLSTFESGRAGSEYLKRRIAKANPSASNNDAGMHHPAMTNKDHIMRSNADTTESRKRGADSVRLSPVKKTRFITDKGIREAGRESLGVTNVDDDDDLDIV